MVTEWVSVVTNCVSCVTTGASFASVTVRTMWQCDAALSLENLHDDVCGTDRMTAACVSMIIISDAITIVSDAFDKVGKHWVISASACPYDDLYRIDNICCPFDKRVTMKTSDCQYSNPVALLCSSYVQTALLLVRCINLVVASH